MSLDAKQLAEALDSVALYYAAETWASGFASLAVELRALEATDDEPTLLEELSNIVNNAPVWPGDTISHYTANACVERGWAYRDYFGMFRPTTRGHRRHRHDVP